jgi:pantothenate kinase
MDGFHLAQQVLDARGLAEVKGAPETFDAAGYVALLRRLRERGPDVVWAPTFDRAIEEPIAGAIGVPQDVELVVTEGNYLLLEQGPWSQVRALLDAAWFADPPDEDVRRARLIARHRAFGEGPERARARALGSDERNARLVRTTRSRADVTIRGS